MLGKEHHDCRTATPLTLSGVKHCALGDHSESFVAMKNNHYTNRPNQDQDNHEQRFKVTIAKHKACLTGLIDESISIEKEEDSLANSRSEWGSKLNRVIPINKATTQPVIGNQDFNGEHN